jgi:hypothetical protein
VSATTGRTYGRKRSDQSTAGTPLLGGGRPHMDQREQGRDQVDAAIMPFLRRQRRPSSALRAGLQPWRFHADARDAKGGGTVVADQPAREADQDRRQGHQSRPLRHLPAGRGRGVAADVPRNPAAHRPAAGAPSASVTGRWGQMRQTRTAEVCALMKAKQRVPAPRDAQPDDLAANRVGCDRISLRRALMRRNINAQ